MKSLLLLLLLLFANFALASDKSLSIEADVINSNNNIINADGNVVVENDGKDS